MGFGRLSDSVDDFIFVSFLVDVSLVSQTVGIVPPSITNSLLVMDGRSVDARNATSSATFFVFFLPRFSFTALLSQRIIDASKTSLLSNQYRYGIEMELRHLRYFVGVGEEQHYNRAAQRLGVAQRALSRQVQDLEEEIGFKLFDRLPRGVKLSAAGKCFLDDARRILQQINDATARAKRVACGQSG